MTNSKHYVFFLLVLSIFALSLFTSLARAEQQPAKFKVGATAFSSTLSFPKLENESASHRQIVFCYGVVSRSGRYLNPSCVTKGDQSFAAVVLAALDDVEMTSAVVDGEAIKVAMNIAVLFLAKPGERHIKVLANHLRNIDELGYDYTAAQRIIRNVESPLACRSKNIVYANGLVSSKGHLSQVINESGKKNRGCSGELIRRLEKSQYIPAFSANTFVDSNYREAVYSNVKENYQLDMSQNPNH